MDQVTLDSGPGVRRACLRELRGFDEQAVRDTSTPTAIRLLDRLLVTETETDLDPGSVADLTVAERDALLGAVYEQSYGARVASTVRCSGCNAPFDVDFLLSDLLQSLRTNGDDTAATRNQDGTFTLSNGKCFRLPTGRDELAVLGLPPEAAERALLARCVAKGHAGKHGRKLQKVMQQLAPTADVDVNITCPECEHEQPVRFSLQSYLLTALRQERVRLAREVHRLATAYGWSINEILSLARSERRAYVELVESELFAPSGKVW